MQNSIAAEERTPRAVRRKGDGRVLPRSVGVLVLLALWTVIGAVAAPAIGISVAPQIVFGAAVALCALSALWLIASILAPHAARISYMRASGKHGAARFAHELRSFGHAVVCRAAGNARATNPDAIASTLSNRVGLNLRRLCSDREVLALNASPDGTRALIQASDAVIIDLSEGAPTDWDAIKPEMHRCVFVSAWGVHEQAEATLAALGAPGICFFYAPDGEIQRRGLFRTAVLTAMRAARA